MQLYLARYAAQQFDSSSFAEAGILRPPAIARAVRQRQAEFFWGRLCAQAALADLGLAGIEVGSGAAREPLWPSGTIGSITHSRALAAALALPAGQYRGVGIDVECHADAAALGDVADTVLAPRERRFLRQQHGALSEAMLLSLAFSAKESFYKAVYGAVQRFIDFSAIEIDALDVARGRIGFTVTETLCDAWRCGTPGQAGFELLDDQHVLTGVLW